MSTEAKKAILDELDNREFSWYHVKAILVSGAGFYTDAYDLFIIGLCVPMISYAYFGGKIPTNYSIQLTGAATFGTFAGQLLFGFLGDVLGRKRIYGIELTLIIWGTLCSAMAAGIVAPGGLTIIGTLSFWRFVMGLGIGGDYPLSATVTSEYAGKGRRGMMLASVFAMQGIGIMTAAITALCVLAGYKQRINENVLNTDYAWRICLGLGILPGVFAVYFRATLPETPRYMMEVANRTGQAAKDLGNLVDKKLIDVSVSTSLLQAEAANPETKPSWQEFAAHFSKWNNLKVLLGTSLSWFFLDIAWYGLGLNSSIVLSTIGYSTKGHTPYDALYLTAVGNAVITMMGTVPGYWVAVATIERLGRRNIQIIGFTALTILFVVLSAAYVPLTKPEHLSGFITLYTFAQFFFNFGPNTTTFVIPGEVFPTRYRSTCHGISAGTGKLGAIIAAYGFAPLRLQLQNEGKNGLQIILGIFSILMFCGLLSTIFLIPEPMGLSLEEVVNMVESGRASRTVVELSQPRPNEGVDNAEKDPVFIRNPSDGEVVVGVGSERPRDDE